MTERPRASVHRTPDVLRIGRSRLRWLGGELQYDLDERCSPLPMAVRGRVIVQPGIGPQAQFKLDEAGHHTWSPLAPCARVHVRLEQPQQSWSGHAYLDSNWGDRPLEQDFRSWQWSRTLTPAGTSVFYEPVHRLDAPRTVAVRMGTDGSTAPEAVPDSVPLPRSGWGIARSVRSRDAQGTAVVRTLLDAPFYARTLVNVNLCGAPALCVHESLNLERFRQPWVRSLLPFRMPRLGAAQRPAETPTAC